jgi:hypothetical protein
MVLKQYFRIESPNFDSYFDICIIGCWVLKCKNTLYINNLRANQLAEAVRFELTEGINPRRFSRPVP